jgi:TRAP-type C4-dicarboxylate transport system permease small subunit
MKKGLDKYIQGTARVNWGLGVASAIVGFALVGMVIYGVFTRYVLKSPTALSLELPQVMFIAMISLALVYAQMQGSHVIVEVLVTRLHGKPRKVLFLIASTATVVYCGIVIWALWQRGIYNLSKDIGTIQGHIPLGPFSLLIVLGIGLLALQVIIETVKRLSADTVEEGIKPHH